MSNLSHLPNTRLTPEVVLHQALDDIAKIKSVVVIIELNDETFDINWSRMPLSKLTFARFMLDRTIDIAYDEAL